MYIYIGTSHIVLYREVVLSSDVKIYEKGPQSVSLYREVFFLFKVSIITVSIVCIIDFLQAVDQLRVTHGRGHPHTLEAVKRMHKAEALHAIVSEN